MKRQNLLTSVKQLVITAQVGILFVLPVSNNYQLKSYEFGGGGGESVGSNYGIEGTVDEVAGEQVGTNYSLNEGLVFQQNANVPTVTLVNSSNWYNKLHVTIDEEGNASDATYAIAISTDNFATTNYVQNDNTIGASLGSEDYQTYAAWGGGSGEDIIGLSPSTTYKVKVKALQGRYTESAYGPVATAATVNSTLNFDIDVASTDTESAAPYTVNIGSINISTLTTATDKIWIDLDTNAASGAYVYLYGTYSGLKSTNVNHTISSSSVDLSGATEGYGLRADSATNLTKVSPYNGASENIGVVDTTIREILHSSGAPVSGGRASVLVKVKTSDVTPSANDYTDTLTFIASGSF